jgi:1-acyl-sn-glycerol-3-phosphate acyltransferase
MIREIQERYSNYLIISNHLSYLDILIISIYFPSCFVTSKEMKHTPFLGQVCLLGGCLFVERRKKAGLNDEVKELSESLKKGLNVAIFPEAKSTNGEAVLSFKRPLFQAAILSQARVLPVCINYLTLDGEKLTLKNRDNVFWYGDTAFLTHVLRLFSHRGLSAELVVLPSIDAAEAADKTALADKAYASISSAYKAIKEL